MEFESSRSGSFSANSHADRSDPSFPQQFAFSQLQVHLMTLSARYRIDCGIVTPICLAVFRLITSSNFVGCSTGISAGFIPLRILSRHVGVRRHRPALFGRIGKWDHHPQSPRLTAATSNREAIARILMNQTICSWIHREIPGKEGLRPYRRQKAWINFATGE